MRRAWCSIEGCGKKHHARGWCERHYVRWVRNGDPLGGVTSPGELERFYQAVVLPHEGDDCLIWPYTRRHGRGSMKVKGVMTLVACEEVNGPPPTTEHQAAHGCGKGHLGCVTKKHLRWATPKENQADRVLHGTWLGGASHPLSKLTEVDVLAIRASKDKVPVLANRYGTSTSNIYAILNRETWRSLP